MKSKKRIYCIEGVWDDGPRMVEPSVEPMLEILRRQGLWEYMRRDCATTTELVHYLGWEWPRCKIGSVLYIAAHGDPCGICLSNNEAVLSLDQLGNILEGGCEHCLVHFGACSVLDSNTNMDSRIDAFLKKTKAMGVSGYSKETGWTSTWAPALALELMLFSSIEEKGISLANGRHFRQLRNVVENLQYRFEDCGFMLYTRTEKKFGA